MRWQANIKKIHWQSKDHICCDWLWDGQTRGRHGVWPRFTNYADPGTVIKVLVKRDTEALVMADTEHMRKHYDKVEVEPGARVMLLGLGLGIILPKLAGCDLTVIEKYKDIIDHIPVEGKVLCIDITHPEVHVLVKDKFDYIIDDSAGAARHINLKKWLKRKGKLINT